MGETIMIQQMKRGRIQLQYIKGKGQVTKQLVQWHNFFFFIYNLFFIKKTIFLNTETIMESTHSKKKKNTTLSTTGVIIGFFNDVTC